ncbi:MAG TPA: LysR substrate-binding domain-containing protein [Conexibacter sp.]|jgi:DNA-binding transcriptional LysR family regulator
MPELRQLRAFLAVAQELNFTRAAQQLHIGQQAVSKTVAQLERELGVELLERTTREVRLTPAGAALVERGRGALAAVDDAFAHAQKVGGGLTGTVTVAISPAVGDSVRAEVVEALRAGSPELTVQLTEGRPSRLAEQLRRRQVDCAVVRSYAGSPEVDSVALPPTPAVLYVPASHPLAALGEVPIARLDGMRLLVFNPPGSPFTDIVLVRLAAGGATVEPVEARVIGGHIAEQLAEHDAVILLPRGWGAGDGLVELPLAEAVSLPLLLLWAAGMQPVAVRRLRERMSETS